MGEDTREINDHRYCSVGNGGETRKAHSMAYKSSPTPRKKKKKTQGVSLRFEGA